MKVRPIYRTSVLVLALRDLKTISFKNDEDAGGSVVAMNRRLRNQTISYYSRHAGLWMKTAVASS